MAVPYIPAGGAQRFQFLNIHANTLFSVFVFVSFCFDSSYPNGCEMVSHCGFGLRFPNDSDVEHVFMGLSAIGVSSLERGLSRSFAHSFSSRCCLSIAFSHVEYSLLHPLLQVRHSDQTLVTLKSSSSPGTDAGDRGQSYETCLWRNTTNNWVWTEMSLGVVTRDFKKVTVCLFVPLLLFYIFSVFLASFFPPEDGA